jgi:glycosyltransferase involved in cell wall biosynthesis
LGPAFDDILPIMTPSQSSARSPRVLLIEPCFENYGGYYRASGIARALALSGYQVDLLISSRTRFTLKIEKQVVNARLTIYKLPRLQFNAWFTGRFLRAFVAMGFFLFRRYDIIHLFAIVQFESLIPFLFLRLCMPWKKVILDWDDYWTEVHTQHPSGNLFEMAPVRFAMRFCEYTIQKLARHITVTSRFLEKEVREKLGVGHCFKIINGVDRNQCEKVERNEARKRLGIGQDELLFLTFGNSFHNERTTALFQLFEHLYRLDPRAQLIINIDPSELWGKYGGELQLDPAAWARIRNVGYLGGEKLSNWLGAADAVLFTMTNDACEIACFPTRVGTFLNGEKIIAMNENDSEARHTLMEHNAVLVDSSLEKLAQRLMGIVRDPAMKAEWEQKSREARVALSWESLAPGIAGFYREIQHTQSATLSRSAGHATSMGRDSGLTESRYT